MKQKGGFTLIEMLLGLFYGSIVLMLGSIIFLLLFRSSQNINHFDQNKIGLIQLQNELSIASDFSLIDQEFCYFKFEKEFCLSFDQNRLVKRPGDEIYLIEVKEGTIHLSDDTVNLSFKSGQTQYEEIIKLP